MKKAKRQALSIILTICMTLGFSSALMFTADAQSSSLMTYRVNFSGGGGDVHWVPSPQIKTHNVPLSLTSQAPSRAGHTFLGWARNASASVPDFRIEDINAGLALLTDNTNITLYAVWLRDGTSNFTIVYNLNGGIGTFASQMKRPDIPLQLSSVKPVREGYEFVGWGVAASSDWSASWGAPPAGWDANWWNVWDPEWGAPPIGWNPSWWNSWDANWLNSSGDIGWWYGRNTAAGSDPVVMYQPGDFYTLNANLTLYAVWRQPYTVTFNANGGTVSPSSAVITANGTLASLPIPIRANHTFTGWFTATVGGSEITSETKFSEDTIIYAQWSLNTPANTSIENIEAEITAAANLNNGSVVAATMVAGSTSVPKEILAIMAGKNIKLTLDFGNSGRVTIDGRSINYVNSIEDLNLLLQYSMSTSENAVIPDYEIPISSIDSVSAPVHQVKIGMREMGIRGSTVTMYPGTHYAGMNALLCIYNASTDGFELISGGVIDISGSVTLDFDRTGDFVLIVRHVGDVTGTGTVTANDALEILRAVTGRITLDPSQIFTANSRRDGTINANDALNILKLVAGLTNRI